MRVAVSESSGPLSEALRVALAARGDDAVLLTRTPRDASERGWDPAAGTIDGPGLEDVDAVINLYGAPVERRWTPQVRDEIRGTRVTATVTVVNALDPDGRCQRFLNLSSTDFYGDSGDDEVSADSPAGTGFLAGSVVAWESAARLSPVPTSLLRTPNVLSPRGAFLGVRSGWLAGRVGSGRQWVSWIHIQDWAQAALLLLDHAQEGPINLCSPHAVREDVFVSARARVLRRRPWLPVPDAIIATRYGSAAARELWHASTQAYPQVLTELGFTFRFPTIEEALADVLRPTPRA